MKTLTEWKKIWPGESRSEYFKRMNYWFPEEMVWGCQSCDWAGNWSDAVLARGKVVGPKRKRCPLCGDLVACRGREEPGVVVVFDERMEDGLIRLLVSRRFCTSAR